jgi:hypothetical protein
MTIYCVTNWNDIYENNRSRILKDLKWVPIPNGHDGEAYSRLMLRKDAAVIFSAWILILQVASRCEPRGELIKAGGEPHDAASLSIRTRAPKAWFERAIPVLVEMRWVSRKALGDNDTALGCHDPALTCRENVNEGREEKEGNGKKEDGRAAGAAPASDAEWLAGLRTNPAFHGIDVDRELAKARLWADTKRRKCSRQFLVNWLNRAEKPMQTGSGRPAAQNMAEPTNWKTVLNHEFEDSVYSSGGIHEAHTWASLPREVQGMIWAAIKRAA